MRAVIQRVKRASVITDNKNEEIGQGLLIFLGVGKEDSIEDVKYMVDKIIGLRIFEDDKGKMNLSVKDIKGELLIISQFTLYGDVRKGRRPSFTNSASSELGEELYNAFINEVDSREIPYSTGVFGADMDINLINDGPVTILLDSKKTF